MSENRNNNSKKSFKDRIKDYFLPKGIQLDRLRYRPNKICYNFGFLACAFLCLGFAVSYSGTSINETAITLFGKERTSGAITGIDVLINILLLLFRLTSSIQRKNYSKSGSILAILRGIFNIVRVFFFPLSLLKAGIRSGSIYSCVRSFYICSGAFLILAGLLTFFRGKSLRAYLKTVKPIENEKGN